MEDPTGRRGRRTSGAAPRRAEAHAALQHAGAALRSGAAARRPRAPRRPEPVRQDDNSGMKSAGVGLQFAVSILLFLYVGQWLDRRFGTSPWLMMTGVFLGGGGAFYSMYRRLVADQAREDAARRARSDAERKGSA